MIRKRTAYLADDNRRRLHSMSKILEVTPNDNYNFLVKFGHGNKIIFNMRDIIKTIPFNSMEDLSRFKDIMVEEKAICWPEPVPGEISIIPLRLMVDNMLFTICG
jgi:hypothetical protein